MRGKKPFSLHISSRYNFCYLTAHAHAHAHTPAYMFARCGELIICSFNQVRAKTETYEDKSRVKCSIVSMQPLNFANESKSLLERIQMYGV
jgi:hypothetical protein